MNTVENNSRRNFIGKLAATATTATMAGMVSPLLAGVKPDMMTSSAPEAEAWFKNIKGKHKIVYDATEPHEGYPFIWSWVFYQTNNQTGTSDKDMTAMVVLRHNAIPFAFRDEVWQKYQLGKVFGVNDNNTNAPAIRNTYYEPKGKDFPFPIINGMKEQQERGAMFCVCEMAIAVYSGAVAQQMGLDPEAVKKEWVDAVLPGVQIVPSGVWAVNRAQEHGCSYCYAGG